MQTCPNDRRKFEYILVRLDLEGEVIRKIPVHSHSKNEEEDTLLDITECQVSDLLTTIVIGVKVTSSSYFSRFVDLAIGKI